MNISTIRTPWTAILAAQHGDTEARARCLTEIAEKYYGPVRAYIAALAHCNNPDIEDDLAQGFFHKFLEREILNRLDRDVGQFRQFLKTAVRNYVKDEISRAGRNNPNSPLTRHHSLPAGEIALQGRQPPTPEDEFNRRWAQDLVNDAVKAFRMDCHDHVKQHYFAVFERHVLTADGSGGPDYAATAHSLGISEKDVANYLHRARKRFRGVLLEMVRATVRDEDDVEKELVELRQYFRS